MDRVKIQGPEHEDVEMLLPPIDVNNCRPNLDVWRSPAGVVTGPLPVQYHLSWGGTSALWHKKSIQRYRTRISMHELIFDSMKHRI